MNLKIRRQIAEELLGCVLDEIYAPCPGIAQHTHGNGRKDFRVTLDGAPTGFCYHKNCGAEIDAFNLELRRRIYFAEEGNKPPPKWHWGSGVVPEPKAETIKRPDLDLAQIEEFTRGIPSVGEHFLRRRSPIDVNGMSAHSFLDHLYTAQERVLIFTSQTSQGDFLWQPGRGGFRLSRTRGVKAKPSALPKGGPDGVWYLVQPVEGTWRINSKGAAHGGSAKWTRRSECNVTCWRYFVLEADDLDAATWLRVLVNLPVPISAIYTSGKRSIHALMRWDTGSKPAWDATRDIVRQIVCPLGADPAALTAVRLSRLPSCLRGQQMQKLLYLNPDPTSVERLRLLPELRQ